MASKRQYEDKINSVGTKLENARTQTRQDAHQVRAPLASIVLEFLQLARMGHAFLASA